MSSSKCMAKGSRVRATFQLLLVQKILHPFLINYLHSQLFRLIELRTRIRSGDNIVRFLADRPRDLPTRIFDHLLGFVARVMSQGSSEHECFAGQFGATLLLLACELEAGLA